MDKVRNSKEMNEREKESELYHLQSKSCELEDYKSIEDEIWKD